MKDFKIIHVVDCCEVRNIETQEVIFSTKVPDSIREYVNRPVLSASVVDNVVNAWNQSYTLKSVDEYLLDEGYCSQEEREVIIESLLNFHKGYFTLIRCQKEKDEFINSIPVESIKILNAYIDSPIGRRRFPELIHEIRVLNKWMLELK